MPSDSALGRPRVAVRQGGTMHLAIGVVQVHVVVVQGAFDLVEVGTQGGSGLTRGVLLNLPGGVANRAPNKNPRWGERSLSGGNGG